MFGSALEDEVRFFVAGNIESPYGLSVGRNGLLE
jgi:hypothetical protein